MDSKCVVVFITSGLLGLQNITDDLAVVVFWSAPSRSPDDRYVRKAFCVDCRTCHRLPRIRVLRHDPQISKVLFELRKS